MTAADQPVPELLVRLLDTTGHEVARTFTLADGRYFFDLPPVGSGYLIVPALPAVAASPAATGIGSSTAGTTAV